jgi:pimeloyl-ACP methyl ester carboxylesterase
VRFYKAAFGRAWQPRHSEKPTLRAPTGIAVFPKELRKVSPEFAREHANLVHWTEMPRGGHFAASEEPELLIGDLRRFFRPLRAR